MLFAIIDPFRQKLEVVNCKNYHEAKAKAGLKKVDHGVILPRSPIHPVGIGIVVYEFGLYTPPAETAYFAIHKRLYAGNAVLYGFDKNGDCVSLTDVPQVLFMQSGMVERNIALGLVDRPCTTINDKVIWEWPQKRPL